MTDPGIYLEKLTLFGQLLRNEGLSVGPRENGDAGRVLSSIGMEERETVKAALCTVYAKSREEQLRFSRVFDSFFRSEDDIRGLEKKCREQERAMEQARAEARRDLDEMGNGNPFSEEQQEAYARLPAEERERLRSMRDKYIGPESRNPELYSQFIHSVFARSILEQQMLMEDAAIGAPGADPELGMLFRDIGNFSDTEIPKAVDYIQTIARQINGEMTRKRKNRGHDSHLDFRPTIRRGLETGGRFYHLVYRKRRSRRKQLVILCDVSASMIQFSEFVLRFIRALNQASDSSRIFLFSEELREADPFRLQNMDLFREYVRQSGIYGRGTALGKAVQQLNDLRPPVFSPAATLLIVSDAKTIDENLAIHELMRARQRCGQLFWLNPIPRGKWKLVRSIQTMSELIPMLPCGTLHELGEACRKLTVS